MDSRFNIPAPPTFKPEVRWQREEPSIESGGPARGRGGYGQSGFLKLTAKKHSGAY